MSQAKPNSRVLWLLLPVMVCVFAVLLETPAIMDVPLGIAALLAAGFGTRLFHKLSERSPFFLVFLDRGTGVTSLYFGTIFVMAVALFDFRYFDARVTSHWTEWFILPLFMLGSLPTALATFIALGGAFAGVVILAALRLKRPR